MRTTVDLPDALLRQAKARAALDGLTLKELIARYVEQGLREGAPPGTVAARRARSELPVARPASGQLLPLLTNADIERLLEEAESTGGQLDRSA